MITHKSTAVLAGWLLISATVAAQPSQPVSQPVAERLFEPRDTGRDRTVPVKVYLPESSTAPLPVLLFSHGLGGSRNNSPYLGQHWAAADYVAVFMQHAGSDEAVWRNAAPGERLQTLTRAASYRSSMDRIQDVSFVLDKLEKWNAEGGHALHGRLDLQRVGMSGHSFGAVTSQALMGRTFALNRQFRESRLDAFLLMSPSSNERPGPQRSFGHIELPVLCMTGTEDGSPINPATTPESRKEVFAALPAGDKYQLVFDGGQHHVFSDRPVRRNERRDPRCHPAILRMSTAFWDAYLKDDREALQWLQSEAPRSLLVDADEWSWK